MSRLCLGLFCSIAIWMVPSAPLAGELETFRQVVLVETDWADGDSFRVRFKDGQEHTLRLYGADCLEWHIGDESDARRLRAQRRYFGISDFGDSPQESIELAKSMGEAAAQRVQGLLARPFTVHTAFADGRGDAQFDRVYAFVETADGEDLASALVLEGLARAFGVYRGTPDGLSQDDYREQLKDAELVAARKGRGVWEFTDWDALPEERRVQRQEDAETQIALGTAPPTDPVNVNHATRGELMRIPGIGEVTANRIIEGRPYTAIDDLQRVRGIGAKTLESIRPYVSIQ